MSRNRTFRDRGAIEAKVQLLKGIPLLGFLPYRDSIIRADMDARPPFEGSEDLVDLADQMIGKIIQEQGH